MEKYYQAAAKFAQEYRLNPSEHIIDVMASVMMTRDNVQQGGSFVQSVVKNDLFGAISRADSECLANIKIIVLANQFAHIR